MKTKSSGAGAGVMFVKRRAPVSELCHIYDGSAALETSATLNPQTERSNLKLKGNLPQQ